MLLQEVASTSDQVVASSARRAKVAALAQLLSGLASEDVAPVVAWVSGTLTQRRIGIGWAALRTVPAPAEQPTLTVAAVQHGFTAISAAAGAGSAVTRRGVLAELLGSATSSEQSFLIRLLRGELRQGASVALVTEALGKASGIELAQLRRYVMLSGDLPSVARLALTGGLAALADVRLEIGQPVDPMLAQTARDVEDALTRLGGSAVFETKLDGVRLQVHRDVDVVRLFTRTGEDVTARLPEIVEIVAGFPVTRLVADAEAIALRPDGRPERFQVTGARLARSKDVERQRVANPLSLFIFDVLIVDGEELLEAPTAARQVALDRVIPPGNRISRLTTSDVADARAYLDAALAAGHEGVMAKSLAAPYEAGRRGAGWLKIKPVQTLDLVVLAVEWGSGRRAGRLSNIHLGARNDDGGFTMLGKTFKGMTDEMLAWQTARFLALAAGPTDGYVIQVRPEQVVEIALDGVQSSSRYPAGMALRFARVLRYRADKPASEADTVETVRRLYDRG